MTGANFREGHPDFIWKPNLIGHQQKRVGKKVYESLEERTKAIQEEIFKKNLDTEKKDVSSNP